MLTPFTKILEKYRRESFSEADKGTLFITTQGFWYNSVHL